MARVFALDGRLGRVGDLVFPPVCLGCGGLVEDNTPCRHVCAACLPLIARVAPPCCAVCGHPFFGEVEGERICPHCADLRPHFGSGCTAVLLRGPARAMVIELKYHHGLHVLNDIETIVRGSPHFLNHLKDAVLVPVPLHPRKERERGYNQSQLLAESFARAAGGQTRVTCLLKREVDTLTQTAFDRRSRRENLKNAFALAPGSRILTDQHYILVDDVFTTGSTLNSCASVLRDAGVVRLDVATFGHG
ncbi:MAG: ComF family protein [Opitutaceae bacterium]|nr:ComF family protein [Opitutaceae bacterium]